MPTTEHTINDAIAALLRKTRNLWRASDVVRSENTGMLRGSNKRPDILVIEPNVSPVAIETELLPAATVEVDARSRLGEHLRTTGRQILSCIAVRIPAGIAAKQGAGLTAALAKIFDLDMLLYTGRAPAEAVRWPHAGWVRGSIADLSVLVQSATLPPEIIEEAANQLVVGVSEAAAMIEEMAHSHTGAIHKISEELRQEDGEQTRRMASTILANAFVFHGSLARGPGDLANVASLEELRNATGSLTKSSILGEWRKILRINYWPIFDIAQRILKLIPSGYSKPLIERLALTAESLLANRLMRSHDLAGAVFQRLIEDRKFLAAYYTTPASAVLLAGLAISGKRSPGDGSWADATDVSNLRIADFACGTGTLLSAAYQRIGQLHEIAGGDSEAIHPEMMSSALVGCDVLPAAAHLTASMLAGAHPTVKYMQSSILTVAYGKQPNGSVALGSLELLDPQGRFKILAITAKAAEGMGASETETWRSLPHESFDVVVMNPPFTRATGHHKINGIGVPNPMFAAFSSSQEEQQLMSAATKELTRGTCAHGNAGEASIFLALADRKLKSGGALGLVMPLSLMSGNAWEDSRLLLRKNYRSLVLVSISGASDGDLSFSADTNMGECLVIGRKHAEGSARAVFVVLKQRPRSTLLAVHCARQLGRLMEGTGLRRLEDGPVGGTPLYFGDDEIGEVLTAPLPASGGWNLSRIADLALAQAAYQLAVVKRIWLPGMGSFAAVDLPIVPVESVGTIGPLHRDINGKGAGGTVRGPFTIAPVQPGSVPTYPVLWSHDAPRERTLLFPGDSQGRPLRESTATIQRAIDAKVAAVMASASHCHFNCDFRFNSQSTAMQYTQRRTIGGRAWLSISLRTRNEEKALVLWANSSLGVMLQWWHANRQQPGRGCIGKSTLKTLPILDPTNLTKSELTRASKIFDETCQLDLSPIHEIDSDSARHTIDERFCTEVLGLPGDFVAPGGPIDLLRMKLAREPSIRGRK